jgi:hypothetical protein
MPRRRVCLFPVSVVGNRCTQPRVSYGYRFMIAISIPPLWLFFEVQHNQPAIPPHILGSVVLSQITLHFPPDIHYRNPGLCRVLFIGHSAKLTLPSAALGKVLRSVKSLFPECRTLGTAKHSAKTALPSVKHSANIALGKGPLATVYSWRPSVFAECQISGTRQRESLPSVLCRHSATHILIFLFWSPNFLWYVPTLCKPTCTILDNYNSVFYS